MYVGIHACMYVYMYVGMYVCIYLSIDACMYVCMYVRTYVCMFICPIPSHLFIPHVSQPDMSEHVTIKLNESLSALRPMTCTIH